MQLQSYLDRMGIPYRMSRHEAAFSAQALAQQEHVSGHKVIKPVLVQADGQLVLCALPACCRVDIDALRSELGAEEMHLVDERTLQEVFEDCELGAEPPVGAIFGIPTVMDDSLANEEQVTFQAGTHREAVTMRLDDYRRLAQPGIARFSRPS